MIPKVLLKWKSAFFKQVRISIICFTSKTARLIIKQKLWRRCRLFLLIAQNTFRYPPPSTPRCCFQDENMVSTLTYLCQLHELLRGRHNALWLHLIDETVGDASVSIVEQLADDKLVQVLSVLQSRFGTKHVGPLSPKPGRDNCVN